MHHHLRLPNYSKHPGSFLIAAVLIEILYFRYILASIDKILKMCFHAVNPEWNMCLWECWDDFHCCWVSVSGSVMQGGPSYEYIRAVNLTHCLWTATHSATFLTHIRLCVSPSHSAEHSPRWSNGNGMPFIKMKNPSWLSVGCRCKVLSHEAAFKNQSHSCLMCGLLFKLWIYGWH